MGQLTLERQHEVWRSLWTYCTSLFGDGNSPVYRGSGTFVNVSGVSCLLTAAHVWKHVAQDTAVGFVLEPDKPLTWVPRATLRERFVSVQHTDEWGPDIAVVSIHPADVKRLEVEKAFYRVDRKYPVPKDPSSSEIWAVVGASDEMSEFDTTEVRLKNHMVAAKVPRHLVQDGLDYVEIPFGNTPPEEIPSSWKGLSGAGLWRCHLASGSTENELIVTPELVGVAFYEHIQESRRGFIRCHGPNSLRAHGLDHVA